MKIKIIIIDNSYSRSHSNIKNRKITWNPATIESLEKNGFTNSDIYTLFYNDYSEINDKLNKTIEEALKNEYTHFVFLYEYDVLEDNFLEISKEYQKFEDNGIFLPLISVYDLEEKKLSLKGFYNTCVWKPYINESQIGEIDFNLSKKLVDLSILGAIIPIQVIKENPFNFDSKYYFQFEWLNSILEKDVILESDKDVLIEQEEGWLFYGIPKILLSTRFDVNIKSADEQEKITLFKKVKEKYNLTATKPV